MKAFARIVSGREEWHPNALAPRHRHEQAYAAVVLAGTYEECGSHGRFRVGPRDVLLHARLDAHLDRFSHKAARILNLVDTGWCFRAWTVAHVANADAIARTAETDPISANLQLREQLVKTTRSPGD